MGGLLLKKDKPGKPKYSTSLKPLSDFEEVPIPSYNFSLEVDDVCVALFQKCSGMEVKRETFPLVEGGLNAYAYEFPGQLSFGHVTLETGFSSSDFFWKWMTDGQLDGWIQPKNFTLTQRRTLDKYTDTRKWDFFNAYPVKWKIGDLDVENTQKIIIESLEISFDYFEAGKI